MNAQDANGTHPMIEEASERADERASGSGVEPVEAHGYAPDSAHRHGHAEPVCPYCGGVVPASAGRIGDVGTRCPSCKGLLDALSIQATRGHMGEWFIRDDAAPFRPGCSLATLRTLIERGKVSATSVVRGPDTEQFWHRAGHVPRIARLMGLCSECQFQVTDDAHACASCGTALMSLDEAMRESSWHPGTSGGGGHGVNALAAAVAAAPARSAAAEIAEASVKRQMQRDVKMWARRAGLSIGIAGFLFLTVIALATKDMWWSRDAGASNDAVDGAPNGAAGAASAGLDTAPKLGTTPGAIPGVDANAGLDAPSQDPKANQDGGAQEDAASGASAPDPSAADGSGAAAPERSDAPLAPTRAGRDPLWAQITPLVAQDTNESLREAQGLLQRIIDTSGAERADERAQALATRDWIERRLQARELNALP